MTSERRGPKPQTGRRRAFTLAELLLGMAITAMIALCIAGVTMVLSTASEQATEFYDSTQTSRVTSRKIEDVFRKAMLVTAMDSTSVVLWSEDTNGDDDINITEMVLIKYNASDRTLRKYQIVYPAYWPEYYRDSYDYSLYLWDVTDAAYVRNWITNFYGYTKVTVLAEDVQDLQFTASPAAPYSKVISMSLTVGADGQEVPLRATGHLRTCQADRVAAVSWYHVLTP